MSAVWYPDLTSPARFHSPAFILLGALVGLALRLPLPALIALCSILGLAHGYENGLTLTVGNNAALYAAGVTLAGYLVATLVTATAAFFSGKAKWGGIAIRAVGSWIAAIGIMMMGVDYFPR